MIEYHELLKDITENGILKKNRTGVDTIATFGKMIRFDLEKGFPLMTTKKMYTKGIVAELLFFLKGQTDSKILENQNVNIWKGNTTRDFLDKRGLSYLPEGEIGTSYSHQWRNFGGEHPLIPATKGAIGYDQVKSVYDTLLSNPYDRRMIVNGWCANQLQYMALPPCHIMYIFYANPEDRELSCHLTIRSWDVFLGAPFNIASLALFTHIMAKATGFKAKEICISAVDAHIYVNHMDAIKTQLSRTPKALPTLEISKDLSSFDDIMKLEVADFKFHNYICDESIKADMAI